MEETDQEMWNTLILKVLNVTTKIPTNEEISQDEKVKKVQESIKEISLLSSDIDQSKYDRLFLQLTRLSVGERKFIYDELKDIQCRISDAIKWSNMRKVFCIVSRMQNLDIN